MMARKIIVMPGRGIFSFFELFGVCFVWYSVAMFVLLGTVQGFFLFFLGLHVNLLQVAFWNRELFEVICVASFGGAFLLGIMYLWDRSRMPHRHS